MNTQVYIDQMRPWIEAVNADISDRPGVIESKIESVQSESVSGFISFNQGGWQVETTGWLYDAYSLGKYPACMSRYTHPTEEDLEGYEDHENPELEYMSDITWLYKAYCFLQDGTAVFQVYLCLDEHGRDYISWLKEMGGNPKQTVGNWEVIIPVDEIEAKLPEITKSALEELERLQTAQRNI